MKYFILINLLVLGNFAGYSQDTVFVKKDTVSQIQNIPYGTVNKNENTGSVSIVKGNELDYGTSNLTDKLQGKTTGLEITNQGNEPGQKVDIKIRGIHSINSLSDPLWVLDGMPVMGINTIEDLYLMVNPRDIESIEVLKDARSCAMYGSRGTNGVILIKTKTGRD